jgi:hypothetical protein
MTTWGLHVATASVWLIFGIQAIILLIEPWWALFLFFMCASSLKMTISQFLHAFNNLFYNLNM